MSRRLQLCGSTDSVRIQDTQAITQIASGEDGRLCPVQYITELIQRTEPLRRDSQLLISPYTLKAVRLVTVRRWIHKVLQ